MVSKIAFFLNGKYIMLYLFKNMVSKIAFIFKREIFLNHTRTCCASGRGKYKRHRIYTVTTTLYGIK